ncbi:MAG TPA: hypothetical protein PKD61_28170, partial [Polyangiaceae bacterium]|nr:hypothetical protein [Polyangiaceae bacterium]
AQSNGFSSSPTPTRVVTASCHKLETQFTRHAVQVYRNTGPASSPELAKLAVLRCVSFGGHAGRT